MNRIPTVHLIAFTIGDGTTCWPVCTSIHQPVRVTSPRVTANPALVTCKRCQSHWWASR